MACSLRSIPLLPLGSVEALEVGSGLVVLLRSIPPLPSGSAEALEVGLSLVSALMCVT